LRQPVFISFDAKIVDFLVEHKRLTKIGVQRIIAGRIHPNTVTAVRCCVIDKYVFAGIAEENRGCDV